MIMTGFLHNHRGVKERGVIVGCVIHQKVKSIGHGGAAKQHHDHDKSTKGERKNNQTRQNHQLGPSFFHRVSVVFPRILALFPLLRRGDQRTQQKRKINNGGEE